jgi:hypothetical protein
MAFSATINNTQYIGPARKQLSGTWSGVSGDPAGTMSVAGTVLDARFGSYDVDNTWQISPRVTLSKTGAITTLTINNLDDVATGYFILEVLGS